MKLDFQFRLKILFPSMTKLAVYACSLISSHSRYNRRGKVIRCLVSQLICTLFCMHAAEILRNKITINRDLFPLFNILLWFGGFLQSSVHHTNRKGLQLALRNCLQGTHSSWSVTFSAWNIDIFNTKSICCRKIWELQWQKFTYLHRPWG